MCHSMSINNKMREKKQHRKRNSKHYDFIPHFQLISLRHFEWKSNAQAFHLFLNQAFWSCYFWSIHMHFYFVLFKICSSFASMYRLTIVCFFVFGTILRLVFSILFLLLLLMLSLSCFLCRYWLNGTNVDLRHVTVPLLFIYIFLSATLFFFVCRQTSCISAGSCKYLYEVRSILVCNYFAHFTLQLSFEYAWFLFRSFSIVQYNILYET